MNGALVKGVRVGCQVGDSEIEWWNNQDRGKGVYSLATTASRNCVVVELPPKSRVSTLRSCEGKHPRLWTFATTQGKGKTHRQCGRDSSLDAVSEGRQLHVTKHHHSGEQDTCEGEQTSSKNGDDTTMTL